MKVCEYKKSAGQPCWQLAARRLWQVMLGSTIVVFKDFLLRTMTLKAHMLTFKPRQAYD